MHVRTACRSHIAKQLIPEYGQVRETVFAKGAEAFFISGSGSTMIAVTRSEAEAMKCAAA